MSRWTYSPQKGLPGHCFTAQVWDENGKNLAILESTKPAKIASERARLISAAPELFAALRDILAYGIDSWDATKHLDAVERARAPIAKATPPGARQP